MNFPRVNLNTRHKTLYRVNRLNEGDLSKISLPGVSVVTCSNRPANMEIVFGNYLRQNYGVKELIIILNNNSIDIEKWKSNALKYQGIRVFQLDEKMSLAECLNFAVKRSRFDYIAKFDDDDYYAPEYLGSLMPVFMYTDADIVGKRSAYVYFTGSKTLAIRHPGCENCFCKKPVLDATMITKKEIYKKLSYPTEDLPVGTDYQFQIDCIKNGIKIYSGDRYNFVCIRRQDKESHTWKMEDEELLKQCQVLAQSDDYITPTILGEIQLSKLVSL